MAKYPKEVAKRIAELEAQIEVLKGANSRTLISPDKSFELAGKTCYYDSDVRAMLSRLLRSIAAGPSTKSGKMGKTKIKSIEELTDQEFLILKNAADRILDILIESAEEVRK